MRTSVSVLFSATLATVGCASGAAPVRPDAGSGPTGDGATGATFSYTPAGCAYTVTPPASRGYINTSHDDTSTVDAASGAPVRVRLGLGGSTAFGQPGYPDPTTSAVFAWETTGQNHAAKVHLGTSPTTLTTVQSGYVWTTPPPTVGFGADEPATYMHEVHVCGLKPATTYYYQVGGGPAGQEVWGATQSFTTVPATGSITIGIMGDARDQVTTWQLVHQRMMMQPVAQHVSLELFSGDVVDIGADESLYTQWLDAIWKDPNDPTKFLALGEVLFLPIAGNHENEAVRFYSAFPIPGDGPYAKSFNSFNVGTAHIVMVDDQPIATSMGGDEATVQLKWLDQDLAAANADRQNHPFIIAVSHRGLYSTSNHSADGDVIAARAALAPIFDKYHVDLVFNGHDHEYERSFPLNAGSPASAAPVVQTLGAKGTTYVICAGAGADPYAVGPGMPAYRKAYTQFGSGTPYIGVYGLLTLNGNQLTFTAWGLKGAGGADDMLDTFQLSH